MWAKHSSIFNRMTFSGMRGEGKKRRGTSRGTVWHQLTIDTSALPRNLLARGIKFCKKNISSPLDPFPPKRKRDAEITKSDWTYICSRLLAALVKPHLIMAAFPHARHFILISAEIISVSVTSRTRQLWTNAMAIQHCGEPRMFWRVCETCRLFEEDTLAKTLQPSSVRKVNHGVQL